LAYIENAWGHRQRPVWSEGTAILPHRSPLPRLCAGSNPLA